MNKKKRKALGQHFLKSRPVLRKIVRCINPGKKDLIIEVGAGRGVLTFPLAEKGGKIIAVEKDSTLIPYLEKIKLPNVIILEKDILKVDFRKLIEKEKRELTSVKIVGNIPYSISSPLLFKIQAERGLFEKCIFLLQKEVAERICAPPQTKKYAPLSIIFQIYFRPRLHFIVSPESFSPPPQVESALLSLEEREKPVYQLRDEKEFLAYLKKIFRHRRKTITNNLLSLGLSRALINHALEKCSLESSLRPEQLSIKKHVELFSFLSEGLPGL
ncbi:MAG: 16S rRNA (adenine(1518)-N(6)/adenine(1519)-N(6))-dimethyltransferase RsmA [Candidatus Aminicenantales bacterium]